MKKAIIELGRNFLLLFIAFKVTRASLIVVYNILI